MQYEISAGFIIFSEDKERKFLLIKQSSDNLWNLPKGHIENEESELEAAKRELFEETSINKIRMIDGFKHSFKFINPKGAHRKIILFLASSFQEPRLSFEHTEYKWVTIDDAISMMPFPEQKNAFEEVKKYLKIKSH